MGCVLKLLFSAHLHMDCPWLLTLGLQSICSLSRESSLPALNFFCTAFCRGKKKVTHRSHIVEVGVGATCLGVSVYNHQGVVNCNSRHQQLSADIFHHWVLCAWKNLPTDKQMFRCHAVLQLWGSRQTSWKVHHWTHAPQFAFVNLQKWWDNTGVPGSVDVFHRKIPLVQASGVDLMEFLQSQAAICSNLEAPLDPQGFPNFPAEIDPECLEPIAGATPRASEEFTKTIQENENMKIRRLWDRYVLPQYDDVWWCIRSMYDNVWWSMTIYANNC